MNPLHTALDRRVRDENGHMHVPACLLTRGMVSGYLAKELPGTQERGLSPNDLIPVYRDPAELAKGLESFRDIPLLRRHVMLWADDHTKEDVVGVVSSPRMDGADVYADITLWTEEDGINFVTSGEKEELSCGYLFDLDWTPGEAEGLRYMARMFNIRGNHCALVESGRVPGARVADQHPSEPVQMSSEKLKFPLISAIFQAVLGLTPEKTLALDTALDAELEDGAPLALAKKSKKAKKMKEKDAQDEEDMEAEDEEEEEEAEDKKLKAQDATKKAQDEAVKAAVDQAIAATHALYTARDAVSSAVGVTSLDSAEATYRFALDKASVVHAGVAADALPALWTASTTKQPETAALDQSNFDVTNIFSDLSLIRKG